MKRLVTLSLTLALIISLAAPSGAVFAVSGGVEADVPIAAETEEGDGIILDETEYQEDTVISGHGDAQPVIVQSSGLLYDVTPESPVVAPVESVAQPGVVISQVLTGSAGRDRLVELYNNSNEYADVTGLCVRYNASATPTDTASERYCITTDDSLYRVLLLPRSHVTLLADQLSGGLGNGDKGRVYITQDKQVVDMVAWNTIADDMNSFLVSGRGGHILERHMTAPGMYRDTDHSANDFFLSKLRQAYAPIDELVELPDYCSNFPGLQLQVPDGYERLSDGACAELVEVQFCRNMPDIRLDELPPEFEVDDEGNCYENVCTNVPGFHEVPPTGFTASEGNICVLNVSLPLEVTELLPNPKGVDDGNEFIELYNPNDTDVDLTWWVFHLNGDYDRVYSFPAGMTIGAGEYAVVKNSDVAFSLRNSSGSVRLRSIDNQHVIDVPEWLNARDDRSWALIDGVWQYADPSPGEENPVPVLLATGGMGGLADCGEGRERNPLTGRCRNIPTAKELAPCKDGQYRSEETNRCRNIALAGSTLKPCREGQYRSEETNRCRSIANAAARVLKPCADDQFRNPETNRCKKIASAEELADCGEGRERNPATNRCRNVTTAASMPTAPFGVEQVTHTAESTFGWWALGGATLLAAGYAGWQWRFEVGRLARKIRAAVSSGPKA